MSPIIIQLIGVAAIVCILWSFQQNKRPRILAALLAGQVLFALHFGLLGAFTAVLTNVIAAARGVVYYNKNDHSWANHRIWVAVFIILVWLGGLITYANYYSWAIVVAMTIETIGLWSNRPKYIRWVLLAIRPLFFIYSLSVGSYAGMLADMLFSISLIIGIVRFDRKKSTWE